MERLRCTHCHNDFDVHNVFESIKEFQKCPKCRIGFLMDVNSLSMSWDALAKLRKENEESFDEIKSALDSPDDFFNSDYEDPGEIIPNMPEHSNCPCHVEPILTPNADVKWNLLLSTNDLEEQRFAVRTAEKFSLEDFEKMDKRFYNTFRPRELLD